MAAAPPPADTPPGDTPPSLAAENRPDRPGRWQGLTLGLLAAAGLAAVVAFAAIFFAGAGEDDDADGPDGDAPRQEELLSAAWAGPPADAREAELIPQAVGGWDLTAADANPGNAMLGVDRDGFHGVYEKVGTAKSVDLAVYRADGDAADAAFAAVRERVEDAARFPGARLSEPTLPGAERALRFDVPAGDATPELHGLLSAAGGWLLLARSETEDELAPFLAAYMAVVESDGLAEPPADIPAGDMRGVPDEPVLGDAP